MGRWLIVALAVLAALPAWAAEDGKRTLTVTMRLAEAEWQVMRQHILPTFEILCDCEVRAIDVPPETLVQRLRAMEQAGRMDIDLFAQDNMRLQELVDAGLVSPLKDEESRMSDSVYPALQAAGVIDDQRYFVPFRPNVQIAYYNADKFAEYGLQPPRTWPELLAVARAFMERDGIGRVLFKGAGGAPTTPSSTNGSSPRAGTRSTLPTPARWRRLNFWPPCAPTCRPNRAAPSGTRPTTPWPRTPHSCSELAVWRAAAGEGLRQDRHPHLQRLGGSRAAGARHRRRRAGHPGGRAEPRAGAGDDPVSAEPHGSGGR